jgi:membrane protein implicated in regulation of membrane protease activity
MDEKLKDYLWLLFISAMTYVLFAGIVYYFDLSIQMTIIFTAMISFVLYVFWSSFILDQQMDFTHKFINGAAIAVMDVIRNNKNT